MSFCYNCGEKLSDDARFCPECGTSVVDESANKKTISDLPRLSSNVKSGGEYSKVGVMLTNSTLLAKKLSVSESDITSLLETYISHLKQRGYCYYLLDLNHFTRNNRWWDYQAALLDIYKKSIEPMGSEYAYLYIIGGDDIIPVPTIDYMLSGTSDDDIESDILYSYPYGSSTRNLLERAEIYKAELLYVVSRLPVANSSSYNDLVNFLQRSLDSFMRGGIEMTHVHAQCDPHWQIATTLALNITSECGLLSRYESLPQEICCYGRALLSPPISHENITKVFSDQATLFFFNLHGSDDPAGSSYYGKRLVDNMGMNVFPMQAINYAKCDNVLAAECCYGARHVGYDRDNSMLYSALMNKTLLFLGSSRIALGETDSGYMEAGHVKPLWGADLMCGAFVDGLLMGYSAGDAMLYARKMFFLREDNIYGDRDGVIDISDAVTLAEFNLYGDPMLGVCAGGDQKSASMKSSTVSKDCYIADKNSNIGIDVEDVTPKSVSLLQRVRGAVDENIDKITEKVGTALYANYGLKPRKPNRILKVKHKSGKCTYNVVYKGDNDMHRDSEIIVAISNEQGEVDRVVMSK